jgi:hypothetical protein
MYQFFTDLGGKMAAASILPEDEEKKRKRPRHLFIFSLRLAPKITHNWEGR